MNFPVKALLTFPVSFLQGFSHFWVFFTILVNTRWTKKSNELSLESFCGLLVLLGFHRSSRSLMNFPWYFVGFPGYFMISCGHHWRWKWVWNNFRNFHARIWSSLFLKFHVRLWSFCKFLDVSWNVPKAYGTSLKSHNFHEVLKSSLKFSELCLFPAFSSSYRNFPDLLWIFLKSS